MIEVDENGKQIVESINNEESELKMDNVATIVTTIVSLGKHRKNDLLLSEKLLQFSNQDSLGANNKDDQKMGKMRANFTS